MDCAIELSRETGKAVPLEGAALRAALADANVPTLLMVYVQLSRDTGMLDRFAPHIRPAFSPEPSAVPDALAEDLREKLAQLLASPEQWDETPLPRALMQRMMTVSVGEPVDDEFVPLLLEQMGFERPLPRSTLAGRQAPDPDFKVLVIGAGLTGIVAGIKLGEAGYNYRIIEKNADIGGTWLENIYPGVGVDTPSHFYSYSFELNPEWNHYHPQGSDMQDYLLRVTDKYRLRDNISFETRVTTCVYDDKANLWRVTLEKADGSVEEVTANAVINAHGPLNRWAWPAIAGLENFAGTLLHTAGWEPSLDLRGKKVAVIGTGASAAQLVPAIAPLTEHLTVFQRSKHWVLYNPEIDTPVTPAKKWALRHIPHYFEWFRFRIYWASGDGLYANVVRDPAWPEASPSVSAHNEAIRQYALHYMQSKFADRPDLIAKLTPDYPVFGKRITLDNGWFDALGRDNVSLESDAIAEVLPHAIRMADGREIAVDIIVCATGFNVSDMVGGKTFIGRDGRSLADEWGSDDARSYMGITMPGYPNLFYTVGPNSAPNHAAGQNLISEAQIHYIIECLDALQTRKAASLEPSQAVFDAWNAKVDGQLAKMIWSHPKANGYYKNSRGRNFMSFPFRLVDYWTWTRAPELDQFEFHK